MSIIMFVLGAGAAMAGLVLIAAGIPVKEFSFGNTLILAGTVSLIGGLIVFGLGAVIAQLHRIADMLGARPATRSARPLEPFETPAGRLGQGPGQIPFPPKAKAGDSAAPFAAPAQHDSAENAEPDFAPALRNPDDSSFAPEPDHAPLMPRPPSIGSNGSAGSGERIPPAGGGWRPATPPLRAPQPSYFEAMWPAKTPAETPAKTPALDGSDAPPTRAEPAMREPPRDTPMRDTMMRDEPDELPRAEPAKLAPAMPAPVMATKSASEMRAVPVLKSGVIDGMGYTLYVDGSIEAELPQGMLRFASIAELREHLEKSA